MINNFLYRRTLLTAVQLVMKIGLFFFGCTAFSPAFSQNGFQQNDFQKTFKVIDPNGRPFVNPLTDVTGSPFFKDEWNYGTIKLTSNVAYANVQLKVNLLSQEIHFLNPDKIEMVVTPGLIREVVFTDSSENLHPQYDFICGFPATDNQTEKNFYLIRCAGKITLLQSMRKKLREAKDDMSGEVKKELLTYDDYYSLTDNALTLIKLSKAGVLQLLHDKQSLIEAYVSSNRLSYKSGTDVTKIVTYYNTL